MVKFFLNSVENIVGKGENASQNVALCGNGLTTLEKKIFGNIVGKEENTGKQPFLLFQKCFLLYRGQAASIRQPLLYCLYMLSVSSSPKFCRLVKG